MIFIRKSILGLEILTGNIGSFFYFFIGKKEQRNARVVFHIELNPLEFSCTFRTVAPPPGERRDAIWDWEGR